MYYNKAILIGFVGADPNVHYSRRGTCQATLRLATSVPGYTRRDGTQIPERTEWHTVVIFGSLAQFVERWVRKGSHLLVEGEIRYNNYTDRQGQAQARTEIWADKVTFVNRPKQSDSQESTSTRSTAEQPVSQSDPSDAAS
ncbi:single-stranded DNA-binding protein [uncultured Porphyromonas sp.]|uniref:single-stranded DNA-binding protein n=1 Tax=uncultured Porphyromonas sp. TaxID=159274 RepID=UPI00280623E0|nr:single-stranded DNA-binding protein [uncultured Porphyromonas sp.]